MQLLDTPTQTTQNHNLNAPEKDASELEFESEVLEGSLTALVQSRALTPEEKAGFAQYLSGNAIPVSRLLSVMAELREIEEGQRGQFVEVWGRGMAIALKKRYSLIPFAARLLSPTSFYEQYEQVHEWAKQMRVPVIFSEDADVVGLGCINPVACEAVASRVSDYLYSRLGSRPLISKVLLDYESWDLVCRKHFVS